MIYRLSDMQLRLQESVGNLDLEKSERANPDYYCKIVLFTLLLPIFFFFRLFQQIICLHLPPYPPASFCFYPNYLPSSFIHIHKSPTRTSSSPLSLQLHLWLPSSQVFTTSPQHVELLHSQTASP